MTAKPCLKGRKRHYFGRRGSGRAKYSESMTTPPRNRCVWCGYNKLTRNYEGKLKERALGAESHQREAIGGLE